MDDSRETPWNYEGGEHHEQPSGFLQICYSRRLDQALAEMMRVWLVPVSAFLVVLPPLAYKQQYLFD
jgi:hypothetical protein